MKPGKVILLLSKKRNAFAAAFILVSFLAISFSFRSTEDNEYFHFYLAGVSGYMKSQQELLELIKNTNTNSASGIQKIRQQIWASRVTLKGIDFWLRYLDPLTYKKINSPIPVEWETEVFEKYEKPYYREGAGLTLMELYLDEKVIVKDTLVKLLQGSIEATKVFQADSTTAYLNKHHHFFLTNRLFLLNLAAIYTTGFECPNPDNIIPELTSMITDVKNSYTVFNRSFPSYSLSKEYLDLYDRMILFVNHEPKNSNDFDHFTFIKDYVNPLFGMNQEMIVQYRVISKSYVDYSLSRDCKSIFDKSLYRGQKTKGIFAPIDNPGLLSEISNTGKQLFYDPRLSANNKRACASCHKPKQYFTDTTVATNLTFGRVKSLPRNTPSLVNVVYNHLLMLDGRHFSLQNQARDVTTNPDEMASNEKEMLEKILSCKEYKKAFTKYMKYTSEDQAITFNHIASAITVYYGKFSTWTSPFDDAMNINSPLSTTAIKGFNLFMSKAQCGTCHYVPAFNGVKPPYIETEFEVLGVPADSGFKQLSSDKGRFKVNPAKEMASAFRTSTIRNAPHTKPYMHNGVFNSLEQVIDFYNTGGGVGKGLPIANQTLVSDSLGLTPSEKNALLEFIRSLDEKIVFEDPPGSLPLSVNKEWNKIKIGGEY